MEKLNLILSICASLLSIISAGASYIFYKKTLKISTKINTLYSNNKLIARDNTTQIVGTKNKVK